MTTTLARWHASRPAWYFRAGEPLDGVEVDVTEDNEIEISGVPRFGNKLAFTSRCTVLDAPSRYLDDPKKPLTVTLAGDELLAFVAQVRKLLRGCLRGRLAEEAASSYLSARMSDCLRFKLWKNGEPTALGFPPPGSEAIVMGVVKPHVAAGRWGLSVTIFELESP